jgi:hypothetical protein
MGVGAAMSVTFSIGLRVAAHLDRPDRFLNLANRNAADLLAWLGLPSEDLCGSLPARDLAARCRRRLWPETRNVDAGLPEERIGRSVFLGRPAGYLRSRTEDLLRLAELAGDDVISWA